MIQQCSSHGLMREETMAALMEDECCSKSNKGAIAQAMQVSCWLARGRLCVRNREREEGGCKGKCAAKSLQQG